MSPGFHATPPPPAVRGRLSRAALLAAGATLMGAAACSDNGNGTDGSTDRGTVSDATGSGGSGGGASDAAAGGAGGGGGAVANDAAAGGSGGGASSDARDDRGAVALYGVPSPDAT